MISRSFKLSQENVSVSQIGMGPSFCGTVSELSSYFKPFLMKMDSSREIPQQIMDVAKVATCATLGRTVTDFHHQGHVLFIVLDGLLKQGLYFFGEFPGILMG